MRELGLLGSKLCSYQAKIFEESTERFMCSSKIFLRRFFNSGFAFLLDYPDKNIIAFDTEECFLSILEDYGDSKYGKVKINSKVMHYLGYITRYICYTRGITSSYLYSVINIYDIVDNYYVYHTQGEEWVIATILEKQKLTEKDLNEDEIMKSLIRKDFEN